MIPIHAIVFVYCVAACDTGTGIIDSQTLRTVQVTACQFPILCFNETENFNLFWNFFLQYLALFGFDI